MSLAMISNTLQYAHANFSLYFKFCQYHLVHCVMFYFFFFPQNYFLLFKFTKKKKSVLKMYQYKAG